MRVLLDTKALIWWHESPEKLSAAVRSALEDEGNEVFMSVVNAWEMQIKTQLGKLTLSKPWDDIIEAEQASNGFGFLVADRPHIRILDTLLFHHRDPFDRLLIAQAIYENLTLISNDSKFSPYPVTLLW